ncbi:hypothetical protein QQ008_14815 [Fulvivirgaceae bacterium BMA10]|uniref:Uncharacterized protein n=1 Tax=Splendidivirga corallicola TaxID=3051826 RepID=A0ABT8KR52_9BACT|nr:hypothetical protein [Fulvivirgaceae bacterium BMA10]
MEESNNNKNSIKEYFNLSEVFGYFIRVFKKRDPDKPSNFNLRMMHGINRISIIMFVLAFLFWLTKRIFF